MHADWLLEHVEVLDTSSGDKSTFSLNDWVSAKAEKAVEIPADGSEQVFQDYQVRVCVHVWVREWVREHAAGACQHGHASCWYVSYACDYACEPRATQPLAPPLS